MVHQKKIYCSPCTVVEALLQLVSFNAGRIVPTSVEEALDDFLQWIAPHL